MAKQALCSRRRAHASILSCDHQMMNMLNAARVVFRGNNNTLCAATRTLLLQMGQGLQPDSTEQNRYSPKRIAPATP